MLYSTLSIVLVHPKKFRCNNHRAKLLIVVKSSIEETEQRNAIRATWMRDVHPSSKAPVVFSVGHSLNETIEKNLLNEANENQDIFQGDYLDSYKNLTLKVYNSLRYLVRNCLSRAPVLFTDSDVILFPKNLLAFASTYNLSNSIVGYCWSGRKPNRINGTKHYVSKLVWSKRYYPLYCSGTDYMMGADVPKKLLTDLRNGADFGQMPNIEDDSIIKYLTEFSIEDILFTGVLRERANVGAFHTDNVYPDYFDYYSYKLDLRHALSVHNFKPTRLLVEYYRKFQNGTQRRH